jgi:hypothetical protein
MGSPLEFDAPATSTEVMAAVNSLHEDIHHLNAVLTALVESHNKVGENIAWLTANTQGIFQMFSDPAIINSMMSGMIGGMANGGPQVPGGPQAK